MSARPARLTLSFAAVLMVTTLAAGPCRGQRDSSTQEGATKEMLRGRLVGPQGYFRQLFFSPDGKLIAAGLTQDSRVVLFDVAAGKEKLRLQMPGNNYDYNLAFSGDGRTLISEGREDDHIRTWDILTGKQLREVKKGGRFYLAFSPGGKHFAMTERGFQQGVQLYDTRTGKRIQELKGMDDCSACTFSPEGKALGLHGHTGGIQLWDVEKNREVRRLCEGDPTRPGAFAFVVFSPDGKRIATGGHVDNKLHVWDVGSGKELLKLSCEGFFCSASFSPDGTLLAAASTDGGSLHDLLNGKQLSRWNRSYGDFVSFSPDGSLLAIAGQTADRDACITLCDMPRNRHEPLPRQLSEKQLETFWADLATDNTFRLQRIFAGLRRAPADAVSFFGKKLQPIKDAEQRRVKKLVQDLDDDDAQKRDRVMAQLQEVAAVFEPLLMEVQRTQEPGEVRNRVRFVLSRLREAPVPPTLLTQLRAVTALEQIGTRGARDVLTTLAKGAAGARLSVEAKQALVRLENSVAEGKK
jgi:hypothetical protein